MSAKKITANGDYILLVNKSRRHVMQRKSYEKDRDTIHRAGFRPATKEEYEKHYKIKFEDSTEEPKEEVQETRKQRKARLKKEREDNTSQYDFI